MENILLALLKGSELIIDLCATGYERLVSDDDTNEDEQEQTPTDETQ